MSEIFSSGLNRTLNKMSATEIILLVVREGDRPGMGPQRSFGDEMFCLYRWMFQGHMYMGWSKPPLCSLYSVERYCTHSGPLGPHYFDLHGSSFEWNLDKIGWFSSDTLVVRASFPSDDQVDSPFLSQILFNLLDLLWIWSLKLLWKSPAWVWVRKALCSCVYQWYYSKCLLVWCTRQCLSHKT